LRFGPTGFFSSQIFAKIKAFQELIVKFGVDLKENI